MYDHLMLINCAALLPEQLLPRSAQKQGRPAAVANGEEPCRCGRQLGAMHPELRGNLEDS